MAQVRIVAWNIQVYGDNKLNGQNGAALATLVAETLASLNPTPNIVVLMELMSSTAQATADVLLPELNRAMPGGWQPCVEQCRTNGNRESYAFFWRPQSAQNAFRLVSGPALPADIEFPNNNTARKGRKPALATFATTDGHTPTYFTVGVYHAPPPNPFVQTIRRYDNAIVGLQALATVPALYAATDNGQAQAVTGRLLCGDYNLDWSTYPAAYQALTTATPAHPPPVTPPTDGGAGTAPAVTGQPTHLIDYADAVATWGPYLRNWSHDTTAYRDSLLIDNVFACSPMPQHPAGQAMDVIQLITQPGRVQAAAGRFQLVFPNATELRPPFSAHATNAAYAYLLYRYGVSDHLPVYADLDL